jgi:gas vesicle protein
MDNSRAVLASLVGAVVGGFAAYLFLTDHGKQLRRQIEPAIEDLARELDSFRTTVTKAASVATEGWKMLNDVVGDTSAPRAVGSSVRYTTPRQTSPF